jgi:hypothetical protein
MLPRVIGESHHESTEELQLLVVHIRTVSLTSRFDDKEMKVRVKHGDVGVSSACDTAAVRFSRQPHFRSNLPGLSAVVDFDASFVFLWQDTPSPSLRIRLVSASGRGRVVGGATVPLDGGAAGLREFDVQLKGLPNFFAPQPVEETIGQVSVAAEICRMARGDLQQHLERLHAHRRQGAFVLSEVPVAVGKVQSLPVEVDDDDDGVVRGESVCHWMTRTSSY